VHPLYHPLACPLPIPFPIRLIVLYFEKMSNMGNRRRSL
jgi:hypothetical protein